MTLINHLVLVFISQDGQTALPDRRLWAALRGGTGVLGPGRKPSGTLLLDDLHPGKYDNLVYSIDRSIYNRFILS